MPNWWPPSPARPGWRDPTRLPKGEDEDDAKVHIGPRHGGAEPEAELSPRSKRLMRAALAAHLLMVSWYTSCFFKRAARGQP